MDVGVRTYRMVNRGKGLVIVIMIKGSFTVYMVKVV
jgi:hypothetical protein